MFIRKKGKDSKKKSGNKKNKISNTLPTHEGVIKNTHKKNPYLELHPHESDVLCQSKDSEKSGYRPLSYFQMKQIPEACA